MLPAVTAIVTGTNDLGQTLLACTLQTVLVQSVPCTTIQGLLSALLLDAGLEPTYTFVSCMVVSTIVLPASQGYHYAATVTVAPPA